MLSTFTLQWRIKFKEKKLLHLRSTSHPINISQSKIHSDLHNSRNLKLKVRVHQILRQRTIWWTGSKLMSASGHFFRFSLGWTLHREALLPSMLQEMMPKHFGSLPQSCYRRGGYHVTLLFLRMACALSFYTLSIILLACSYPHYAKHKLT